MIISAVERMIPLSAGGHTLFGYDVRLERFLVLHNLKSEDWYRHTDYKST